MSEHAESPKVLVVPGKEFDNLGRFQGFSFEAEHYLKHLLVPGRAEFRPRALMEQDPSYKQIIPYVVFRSSGSVFCYTRGSSQGESRLHRLRSLGVGGHVDEADADADGLETFEAFEMALRRELEEEVLVNSPGQLRMVGLINDDSTPVGTVHLGVVHVFELERPEVEPREQGLAEPGFVAESDLPKLREQFETWSQICIDAILS